MKKTENPLPRESANRLIVLLVLSAILLNAPAARARERGKRKPLIIPTVFLKEEGNRCWQALYVDFPPAIKGRFQILAEASGERIKSEVEAGGDWKSSLFFVPACRIGSCPLKVRLLDQKGQELGRFTLNLSPPRKWKVYLVPFGHVDVGFTNSQRKILAQNLENLKTALGLIEETKRFPEDSRFRFFTEVSWPAYEFFQSSRVSEEDKEKLAQAMRGGEVELGAFLISHQNKFTPSEALFRSPEWALSLAKELGAKVRTACLNDLMDFSGVVKPLSSAGIRWFIGGPNTSRYLAPPLFYLSSPEGGDKILCWLTPGLNGYGENFDFDMRPPLPIEDEDLEAMEKKLGGYLKSLEEEGAPPSVVREHFDFRGYSFPYPYDIYLLPFYPAHAVDNGPQDLTPSLIARKWNERWSYPRLIVATPSAFFQEAEERFGDEIPVLKGEPAGFWGEQIFFGLAQVDPEKEAAQRRFEAGARLWELAASFSLLRGKPFPDLEPVLNEAYKKTLLLNDHNPGPVPFGHTSYTKEDIKEWKTTRRTWIKEVAAAAEKAQAEAAKVLQPGPAPAPGSVSARELPDSIILENDFYRVVVDKKKGAVKSLFDRELEKELVPRDSQWLMNQYVQMARGENAGTRGIIFTRPGFKEVRCRLGERAPGIAAVIIEGRPAFYRDQVKPLSRFVRFAFHLPLPQSLVRLILRAAGAKPGAPDRASQEIMLKAGVKAVFFNLKMSYARDQLIDHCLAYPINLAPDSTLVLEGPYSAYRFGPAPPFGRGDLIPAAKMMDARFKSINDLAAQFAWIHGLPGHGVFKNYALALGKEVAVAFSSRESGVIIPGPANKDPLSGPFGPGFFHLALGWTAYGRAFLAAPEDGKLKIHSALTSFHAQDLAQAKTEAAKFGWDFTHYGNYAGYRLSSNPAVIPAALRPLSAYTLLLRLYDAGGKGGTTQITLPGKCAIARAEKGNQFFSEEISGTTLANDGKMTVTLKPGEVSSFLLHLSCPD